MSNGFKGDVIVRNLIVRFFRENAGQDVIEYALLAAFISIVAATIISSIGGDLTTIFTAVKTQTGLAAS
jgi:Flp pilus assembly pilin Flp